MTDITISYDSWCYTNGQKYKTPDLVIRNMIDVWSKRGVVLLNISPKADGTIPEEQRHVLTTIGTWIDKHKEAVFETHPYSIFGYGNAKIEDGEFGGQSATMQYSENDIRFTASKDKKTLYVFLLGLPKPGAQLVIQHIDGTKLKLVSVVGSGVELKAVLSNNVLTVTTPKATDMDEIATVFKVELE